MRMTKETRRSVTPGTDCKPLRLVIPYIDHDLAQIALQAAIEMTRGLNAIVTLVSVREVPFPLPLSRPDVSEGHLLSELRGLSDSSPIPVRILIALARDRQVAIRKLTPVGSLVLVATRRRWWRTNEESLARVLIRDGHLVILLKSRARRAGFTNGTDGIIAPKIHKLIEE
jgi:hypothetical protein